VSDRISVGKLAKAVGLRSSAVRYYEDNGLLPRAERLANGYRTYPSEVVGRLRFIQRAKALGLSLDDIRTLVADAHAAVVPDRERLRHVVAHRLAETERRVNELHELKRQLESMYVRLLRFEGPECGHLGDCEYWLPTDEEVKIMTNEVLCVGDQCCEGFDCPDCLPESTASENAKASEGKSVPVRARLETVPAGVTAILAARMLRTASKSCNEPNVGDRRLMQLFAKRVFSLGQLALRQVSRPLRGHSNGPAAKSDRVDRWLDLGR